MLALWSCGRRAGVAQAQRQIHTALRTAFTIAETAIRTIADQPALAVPGATPASAVIATTTIRRPAYPRCRRAAAGPHEFAAADELGPTWRAARARGVALPRSSGDPPRAADRVSPGGDSASGPVRRHASLRPA